MQMKPGLNFINDVEGEQHAVLFDDDVYDGGCRLDIPGPRSRDEYEEIYRGILDEILLKGSWIVLVQMGQKKYQIENMEYLLMEDRSMLLPVVAPSRADALDIVFDLIVDNPQLSPYCKGNQVFLCEATDFEFVFDIKRRGSEPIHIGAFYFDDFMENDKRREEVRDSIYDEIFTIFQCPELQLN
jgi:hypothetical protein